MKFPLQAKGASASNHRNLCQEVSGEPTMMFFEGFDEAIIGVAWREGLALAVYDEAAMIQVLKKRDGPRAQDALEFLEFNVLGAWSGESTPLIVRRLGHRNG